MSRYIITGGPGSGKTTLLQSLKKEGYITFQEVSRLIIQEQSSLPQPILPWTNLRLFAKLCQGQMWKQLNRAQSHQKPCFFDRGIPDIIAYLKHGGIPVDKNYYDTLEKCNYSSQVFILPPWPEIYRPDPERPHSLEEAEQIYDQIFQTYQELGFELIEVPRIWLEGRVQSIVQKLEELKD